MLEFDCEIEGCLNKTNGFLCEVHSGEALLEFNKIVICDGCNKIIRIEKRKNKEKRYHFIKECMGCSYRHQIEKETPQGPCPPGEVPDQ